MSKVTVNEVYEKLKEKDSVLLKSTGMWENNLKFVLVTNDCIFYDINAVYPSSPDGLNFNYKSSHSLHSLIGDGYEFYDFNEMDNILEKEESLFDSSSKLTGGKATDIQVGGSHYQLPIQPVEYIHKNGIGYFEGNVIKYVTRHKNKNGKQDLLKAKHYIELLMELEYGEE